MHEYGKQCGIGIYVKPKSNFRTKNYKTKK